MSSVSQSIIPRLVKKHPFRRDRDIPGQASKDTFPHWRVWNHHRPWAPTHRHPTCESAQTEADRLANLTPGRRFYIVRVEGFAIVGDPSTD